MAGRVRHDDIIEALRRRYDFHSARTILGEALVGAGLPAGPSYSPEEASRIVWSLNQMGERAQAAVMAMLELVGSAATEDLPAEEEADGDWVQIPAEADQDWIVSQLLPAAQEVARAKLREVQQRKQEEAKQAEAETAARPDPDDRLSWN